ncbi:multi-component transcriptional regulator, winged helix family protein [Cylindrospermum sp. NIES-4074]|nr:multi-component transcriptional regulator, winged helix family protein [Cylindrospermum sp. NIES-4074]
MKILLVEDDTITREIIANFLTAHQYQVNLATDGEMALELKEQFEYDLVILDILLPKLDGISLCKQWRNQGCQTPILLLTAKDNITDRIIGLEAGADDYVTKPFNLEELLARTRALLRRCKSWTPQELIWNGIRFDSASGRVYCGNQSIHLTPKEYCLLELFLLNPKRIFSRQAILDRLWDFAESPGEGTVSTHIKSLRQKLKAVGAADPIETVYGLGYRLNIASESYHPSLSAQSITPSINNTDQQIAQNITSGVWDKFQTKYAEQACELAEIITVLSRKKSDIKLQHKAEKIAHKLAGTLGVFGLMNTSQQAKELEMLLQQTVLNTGHIQQVMELSKVIQQEISNFPTILEPTTQPNSESTAYSPLLLIVDDDLILAEQIRIEAMGATAQANINKWNWRVEIATDITVARKIITQTPPDVILLDLNFPGAGEDGRTLMQELSTRIPRIPIVAFTGRESLKDRVDFACWGGCIFLNKNFPIPVVLQTLTYVLKQVAQTPARCVLIVDNDQTFLQILSNLLTAYGIEVIICANSQEFLQVLTNTQPNLLVLNPQMPVFSGLDLCQVVRTDRKWHNLPVIFISSDTAPEMISQAYTAGADDYLSKSMNKNEIVMRIWQRLQRC